MHRGTIKELMARGILINGRSVTQPELNSLANLFGKKVGQVKPDVPKGQRGGRRPSIIWEIPEYVGAKFTLTNNG